MKTEKATYKNRLKRKIFYRGTNNPDEPNIILNHQLECSFNHDSGIKEKGVSVSNSPEPLWQYFVIVLKVTGIELPKLGSDGETLLHPKSIELMM